MKKNLDMTEGKPISLLWAFTFPTLMGNLLNQVYSITDSIVVGRYLGQTALAAVGSTMPVILLLAALMIGINVGVGIIISRYFGQKNEELMRRAFVNSLYLGLFLTAAVLMLLLIRVLSRAVVRPLLRLAQASHSIAEGDFSSPDLPVKSSDEVGRLTATFNQMKHAMAQQLTTQQALHREEVRNLALEKDLEHTRLEVLKSQVNPHFLFNTLNMISCMARLEDASTTDQMIVHLGSLFRHNLRTKRQQITLEEELDGLEDYIYLQQMRFDGRITVEKSIHVQSAAVLVPSFMLQPVVENAYSHGLKSREEGGRILLRAWMQGKVLVLTVADNGKGMTPEELDAVQTKIARSEQTGRSIGLGNISRRIGMLYPGGKMQIYSRAGHGTVVRFELPQTQQPEEKEGTLS